MTVMPAINPDTLTQILAQIEENPSAMPRMLAKTFDVTEGSIVASLPQDMCVEVPASEFVAIWEAMTEWEKVTFMAESPGAILEISCKLSKGKLMHGMYNLLDKKSPLQGHLLIENIAGIYLVSKPAFKLESHSVQFFDKEGRQCFAVYLGRDETRVLIPSVRQGFLALKAKYMGQ